MRFELRDYQRDAALEILNRLRRGRDDWKDYQSLSSFALSAITGSGKTVIATAVIEALLHGSSDLDTDPDPRIAFLWITDDPSLNRQTRGRMFEASELLAPWALREIDESFPDADLAPGRVYFLNTQKLSSRAGSCRAPPTRASSRSGTSCATRFAAARLTSSWSSTRPTAA